MKFNQPPIMLNLCRTIRLSDRLVINRVLGYDHRLTNRKRFRNQSTHPLSITRPTVQFVRHCHGPIKYVQSNLTNDEHCNGKKFSFHLEENFKTTSITLTEAPPSIQFQQTTRKNKDKEKSLSVCNAKWHLNNVFALLKDNCGENVRDSQRSRNETAFQFKDDIWYCKITLFHPFEQSFQMSSKRKLEAEENASDIALTWLKQQGNAIELTTMNFCLYSCKYFPFEKQV